MVGVTVLRGDESRGELSQAVSTFGGMRDRNVAEHIERPGVETSEAGSGSVLPSLINVEELSAWLGVPVATIYGWRHRQEGPPSYKVGRHIRFRVGEVERWLDGLRDDGDSLSPVSRRSGW